MKPNQHTTAWWLDELKESYGSSYVWVDHDMQKTELNNALLFYGVRLVS